MGERAIWEVVDCWVKSASLWHVVDRQLSDLGREYLLCLFGEDPSPPAVFV